MALLDLGVWALIAAIIFYLRDQSNTSEENSPFKRVAQFVRDGQDEHYYLVLHRNGTATMTYLKSDESGSCTGYWEKTGNVWRICSQAGNQITAKQQDDSLVFAEYAEDLQGDMLRCIVGQTFMRQSI